MRAVLTAVLLAACAHTPKNEEAERCPESRDLQCMTRVECSYDRDRRCKVCRCAPAAAPPGGSLPSGVPPDSAVPPR